MTDGVSIDVSSFKRFAKDMKVAEVEIKTQLRRELKAAGELVAQDARARAGFSSRIPQRIKVGVAGNTVRVYVLPLKAVPHRGEERALEHGGKEGTFRHPVNKDRTKWGNQAARPYLGPAFDGVGLPAAVAGAERAVDKALRAIHG